jgi:hypothetical protein
MLKIGVRFPNTKEGGDVQVWITSHVQQQIVQEINLVLETECY